MTDKKSDPYDREGFVLAAHLADPWYLCGRDLGLAGAVLARHWRAIVAEPLRVSLGGWENFSLIPLYLLFGLSLENLLKGLLIAKRLARPVPNKLSPRLKTPNLERLVADAIG